MRLAPSPNIVNINVKIGAHYSGHIPQLGISALGTPPAGTTLNSMLKWFFLLALTASSAADLSTEANVCFMFEACVTVLFVRLCIEFNAFVMLCYKIGHES